MNWHNTTTVYLKELKDMLRDKRTVRSMIIIPTLVMPAFMFGVGKIATTLYSKARTEIPSVMIVGGDDSPRIVSQLKQSPKLRVLPLATDWKQQISDKKVRAAVEIPAGFFEAGLPERFDGVGDASMITRAN